MKDQGTLAKLNDENMMMMKDVLYRHVRVTKNMKTDNEYLQCRHLVTNFRMFF